MGVRHWRGAARGIVVVRRLGSGGLAAIMVLFLVLPVLSLVVSVTPAAIGQAITDTAFRSALWLSVRTTLLSQLIAVGTGTALAWRVLALRPRWRRLIIIVVHLPVVIPPAVIGVAFLWALGRNGLLGQPLFAIGVSIPFTPLAVVLAQVAVSAPLYVLGATAAFGGVNPDLITVARTLGASRAGAFFRVVLPIALPGMSSAATLAWARALGEFGATLLFAGNLSGRTQTLPLLILTAMEADVQLAVAVALILAAIAALSLVAVRLIPSLYVPA